jgi:phosphopentomutase
VLDRYYAFIDGELERAIAALGPDDLLLVVSGFGMQPVSPGRRLMARVLGEADLSGTHEEAPDGFLLAYGANVVKGRPPRGSLADVAPTILYYLGVPVGRDMDGFARTDLLSRRFTSGRPIAFIPSHDR